MIMSRISMVLFLGGMFGLIAGAIYGWHIREVRLAKAEGIAKVEAENIAKANQQIAERRAADAKFQRTDAMQLCHEAGLEWFAQEGRSYCRVKPAG